MDGKQIPGKSSMTSDKRDQLGDNTTSGAERAPHSQQTNDSSGAGDDQGSGQLT